MAANFSELSPSARMDDTSRLHPALHLMPQPAGPRHFLQCPDRPAMRPRRDPRTVPHRWQQLPKTFDEKELDPDAIYKPTPKGMHSCFWGLSPRMWWTLFTCWDFRCDQQQQQQQLSLPVRGLMRIYVEAYLFNQESPDFVRCLRNFLAVLLPANAQYPAALKQLLFYGMHSFYLQRQESSATHLPHALQ